MSQRAVIVIDLQDDYYPSGRFPLVGIEQATTNAARVIAAARDGGLPVIHVRHEFTGPDAPFFAAGSPGARINSAVAPIDGETVLTKNYPNAFRETELDALLKRQGIKDVVIIGAMSHMCIEAGTRAAADLGYGVTVVTDACATRDLEFDGKVVPAAQVHAASMAALGFAYAALGTTDSYVKG